jgi:hypothetical protein
MENIQTGDLYQQLRIPSIEKRNYWLVRSNGGEYYEDFFIHKYIAIAWDYISTEILNKKDETEIKTLIELNERSLPSATPVGEEEFNSGTVTAIYNKIVRFSEEFEIGDVVLVPSKNSDYISIGTIESDVYEDKSYISDYLEENPSTDMKLCPYHKRRKVIWHKQIQKKKLDIYLIKAFSSHHAISSINEYSEFVDRNLHSIYSKGNELHSTLHAGHPNGLTLRQLVALSTNLEESIVDLSKQLEQEYNENDYKIKINIHSPGLLEVIGYTVIAGITISTLMFSLNHIINGGEVKIGLKRDDVTGKTEFFVDSKSEGFKGRAIELKKLELKELEIKRKEELKEIAKEIELKSPDFYREDSEQEGS